jgi:hypothetical protein
MDRIDWLERELKKLIEAYLKGNTGSPDPGDDGTLDPVAYILITHREHNGYLCSWHR